MIAKQVLLFILFSLAATRAYSSARPDWTLRAPAEDATFKYYLGRASDAPNEQVACSSAFRDAFECAIRANFGFRARVQSESYTTEKTSSATTRYDEATQEVRLQGFEKLDEFIEPGGDGRKSCFALYRYPKVEADRERFRLQNLLVEPKETAFSVQGVESDSFKGVLEVTTKPSGAVVYIDGERFGKTPLRLIGQLEAGEHQVRLDHAEYQTIEERMTVGPNITTEVHKSLVKASGLVNIVTRPQGASLVVDGRPAGLSSLSNWVVEAGVKHRLEISHPEAEKYIQEFEVERGGTADLEIALPLKPALLTVFTSPVDARIEIDGEEFQGPLTLKSVTPGARLIRVTKTGYVDQEQTINLRGGERRVLPTIKLISISEEEKQRQEDEFRRSEYLSRSPWIFQLGFGYSGSPIEGIEANLLSIHVSLEKKVAGWLGLRVLVASHGYKRPEELERTNGTPGTSESVIKEVSASEVSGAVPLYFGERIYLAPELGILNGKISSVTRTYSSLGIPSDGAPTEKTFDKSLWGVSIGCAGLGQGSSQWGWFGELGYRFYWASTDTKSQHTFIGKTGVTLRF